MYWEYQNDKIGYKYIIDAILLCNEYQEINNLKIYSIYEKIAVKYSTNIFLLKRLLGEPQNILLDLVI